MTGMFRGRSFTAAVSSSSIRNGRLHDGVDGFRVSHKILELLGTTPQALHSLRLLSAPFLAKLRIHRHCVDSDVVLQGLQG